MDVPRLLLSAQARSTFSDRLLAAACDTGKSLELVVLEDAADNERMQVQAAWISRDVTGLSTKHTVIEPLAGCY